MYSKKIGRKVDLFYEQWAWHLEDVGNTKKASAVLAKGISNEASRGGGGGRLEKLKADLEVRVVRGLSSAAEEDEENEQEVRKSCLYYFASADGGSWNTWYSWYSQHSYGNKVRKWSPQSAPDR